MLTPAAEAKITKMKEAAQDAETESHSVAVQALEIYKLASLAKMAPHEDALTDLADRYITISENYRKAAEGMRQEIGDLIEALNGQP